MKFDQNGKHIKGGMHRHHINRKADVVDLDSRHPEISDFNLNATLDAIPVSKHEEFHILLDRLKSSLDDV